MKKVVKKKVAKKKVAKKKVVKKTARTREEREEAQDFNKYVIKWNKELTHFTMQVEELSFYGSWRKTGFEQVGGDEGIAYSIDIWAEYKGKICAVESIHYIDKDPRKSLKSLNADMCACVNKWLYLTQKGKTPTIPELQKSAEKPVLHFHRSGALDNLIIQLKQFRSTCLRHGGFRALILESDSPDDPKITVQANFTKECHMLEGRVPPLMGAETVLDQAANRKDRKSREKALPPTDNAQKLIAALQQAKKDGDKNQARKIRGMLRKAGVRGGLRNATK